MLNLTATRPIKRPRTAPRPETLPPQGPPPLNDSEQRMIWAAQLASVGLPYAAELLTSLEGDPGKNEREAMRILKRHIRLERDLLATMAGALSVPLLSETEEEDD